MKKKILFVEDDKQLVQLYVRKFESEGFEVEVATNGEDGLKRAFEGQPNLILLDIMMPQMDGFEMLKKLREDARGKDVPVIILTNLAYSEKLPELKGLYQEYIVKANVEISDIVEIVKKYTQGADLHADQ